MSEARRDCQLVIHASLNIGTRSVASVAESVAERPPMWSESVSHDGGLVEAMLWVEKVWAVGCGCFREVHVATELYTVS